MKLQELPHDPVPKLCGADVELGNFLLGAQGYSQGTGHIASKALLAQISGVPLYGRANTYGQAQDWGRKFLATNGGCAYIDLHHLEVCIPEVLSAYDYVAAWHAMILLARQAADAANTTLRSGFRIQVLANNSDGLGNSYGGHLNILLSRRTWQNIFHRRLHYMAILASYQVSSIVVTGQGKVGAENNAPQVDYQLSQRADFFETISGQQTTFNRPLVNSRDEALCGTTAYVNGSHGTELDLARLHCIFYDSNLCHVANLLKCGMMQIILAMLEAEQCNPDLILDDPLQAVVRFSHDPTLRAKAKTASGKRLTAVELQLSFLDDAMEFHQRGGCDGIVPRADEILALHADTLQKLRAGDFDAVAGRCDWVLKLRIMEQAMAGHPHLTWNSPEMKHLDLAYSNIDQDEGLYWVYENAGVVERVVLPGQIERLLHEPPEDTRAYTRAMLLRLAGSEHASRVDWDSITFKLPGRAGWPTYRTLDLADPLCSTKAEVFKQGAIWKRYSTPWRPTIRPATSATTQGPHNRTKRAMQPRSRCRLTIIQRPPCPTPWPDRTSNHLKTTQEKQMMRFRERHNDPSDDHRDPSGGPSGENLDRIRQAGERLFEAGNDAISRTLSGDSLAFLNATQQEGGQ